MLKLANRYTFVIGEDRKVLKVESGKDAIDPNGAIVSCPIRKPKADGVDAAGKEAGKGSDAGKGSGRQEVAPGTSQMSPIPLHPLRRGTG